MLRSPPAKHGLGSPFWTPGNNPPAISESSDPSPGLGFMLGYPGETACTFDVATAVRLPHAVAQNRGSSDSSPGRPRVGDARLAIPDAPGSPGSQCLIRGPGSPSAHRFLQPHHDRRLPTPGRRLIFRRSAYWTHAIGTDKS
ncbi:uncharacterized protein LOC111079353 [Drosophila obscura]|uniref:uncharacterized protein LOC111079353 n=1 Tax=Drosophila obscura TaxID=7282 RepID=UPI001BB24DDE|nr:uncharacterized protein LOC111079353 [Drosophila obscura]